ncbi:MAG: chloride channel protein [Eubacteriales bacterium]|nr:chloride channel protein [Eubacteriales bacterium]
MEKSGFWLSLRQSREEFYDNLVFFFKWAVFALIAGLCGGVIGAAFVNLIKWATQMRISHPWLLFCMPAAGILIVFLHECFHERGNRGTNLVLEAVTGDKPVDRQIPALIFISTVLSHLVGASTGREGAALQIGGGLGGFVGQLLNLDEKDRKVAVMAGMSAVFAAVFGTPVAAAVFPIEVISVGIMHFSALVPCIFSAFIGYYVSVSFGISFESFTVTQIPAFSVSSAALIILLGLLCGLCSKVFCKLLHLANRLYSRYTPNSYVRILAASVIFIVLTLISGTDLYEGTSMAIIERSLAGSIVYEAFLLKMIFTAIALGGKFKGGEIVPVFCVGAALGCTFGNLVGFAPSLCAACGLAGLFAGATNCPVSTLLIALEMLSPEAMPYYSLAIAAAFLFSGYTSLYSSQRILYSKTRPQFINRMAE